MGRNIPAKRHTRLNMKENRYILYLFVLLFFASCSNKQERAGPVTINMKALNGLKFDKASFDVKPGVEVTLTFTNESDMAHNFVITRPGEREHVVKAAMQLSEKGPQMNFIPATNAVLWSVPVISPGQKSSMKFTAPTQEGIYPYVCTYPGHGFVMFGEM